MCFLGDFPIFRPSSGRNREVLTLISLYSESFVIMALNPWKKGKMCWKWPNFQKWSFPAYFGVFERLKIIVPGKKWHNLFLLIITNLLIYIYQLSTIILKICCFLEIFQFSEPPTGKNKGDPKLIFLDSDSVHTILTSKNR